MMKQENDMCNGWRNYQTWTISLWYGDCFADMASEQKLHGVYLEEMVVEMEMDKIPESSLAADIMNDFLRKVDWDELADHYNADSGLEEEEEEGFSRDNDVWSVEETA